jgi:hypothetical protein
MLDVFFTVLQVIGITIVVVPVTMLCGAAVILKMRSLIPPEEIC